MGDFHHRYARQLALPEIGKQGQELLQKSRVMIVGCGALGSMVAMQLAGAGVGTLGLADPDTVDISNLQRQFFFKTQDAGKLKSQLIGERVLELNPEVKLEIINELIIPKKSVSIFEKYDFIVDATDNPESKKMIGNVCQDLSKPCCIGGVSGFRGQVMTILPGDAGFEEYFGEENTGDFLPCSMDGVFGPAASICASIQTSEVIKFIVKVGELLSGRLLTFNLLTLKFHVFKLS